MKGDSKKKGARLWSGRGSRLIKEAAPTPTVRLRLGKGRGMGNAGNIGRIAGEFLAETLPEELWQCRMRALGPKAAMGHPQQVLGRMRRKNKKKRGQNHTTKTKNTMTSLTPGERGQVNRGRPTGEEDRENNWEKI